MEGFKQLQDIPFLYITLGTAENAENLQANVSFAKDIDVLLDRSSKAACTKEMRTAIKNIVKIIQDSAKKQQEEKGDR